MPMVASKLRFSGRNIIHRYLWLSWLETEQPIEKLSSLGHNSPRSWAVVNVKKLSISSNELKQGKLTEREGSV